MRPKTSKKEPKSIMLNVYIYILRFGLVNTISTY